MMQGRTWQGRSSSKKRRSRSLLIWLKALREEVTTDTISVEIVNQLRGQISERFIRECLHEKYKQKVRVDNARKQKQGPKKDKEIDKLAVLPPLNPMKRLRKTKRQR